MTAQDQQQRASAYVVVAKRAVPAGDDPDTTYFMNDNVAVYPDRASADEHVAVAGQLAVQAHAYRPPEPPGGRTTAESTAVALVAVPGLLDFDPHWRQSSVAATTYLVDAVPAGIVNSVPTDDDVRLVREIAEQIRGDVREALAEVRRATEDLARLSSSGPEPSAGKSGPAKPRAAKSSPGPKSRRRGTRRVRHG